MRFILPSLALSLILAGCTDADWNHALTYSGVEASAAPATNALPGETPVPVQATAAAPDTGFCESVAHQDAGSDGLDAATQARVFQRTFRQCVEIFGADSAPGGSLAALNQVTSPSGNGTR